MKTKIKHGLNLKPEERFLFERLPDVLRLEAATEVVRQKYSDSGTTSAAALRESTRN